MINYVKVNVSEWQEILWMVTNSVLINMSVLFFRVENWAIFLKKAQILATFLKPYKSDKTVLNSYLIYDEVQLQAIKILYVFNAN